ncbi:MAG TPA: hypothetical protein H9694_07040 [Firmicutes bacterium]|nr:hypothetical protein [Bacillota bacterium]
MTGNWSKNYQFEEKAASLSKVNHLLSFDITQETKKWCMDDGQAEHNGLLLKSASEEEGIYNVILSNDNSIYRTKTVVHLAA